MVTRQTRQTTKRPTAETAGGPSGKPVDLAPDASPGRTSGAYVVPLVHARVPEPVVTLGFVGLLIGTVAMGVVDAPLAGLVGLGVVVARHRRRR